MTRFPPSLLHLRDQSKRDIYQVNNKTMQREGKTNQKNVSSTKQTENSILYLCDKLQMHIFFMHLCCNILLLAEWIGQREVFYRF